MRFIAAIPNYNQAANLPNLLKSALQLGFDEIFVLDDASTDDSLDQLKPFEKHISIIAGSTNLGPAGNRNRIMGHLRQNDVICFIDADMELLSNNIREQALAILDKETSVGIIGGLIFNEHGDPTVNNYGYYSSPWRIFVGTGLSLLARVLIPARGLIARAALPVTLKPAARYLPPIQQQPDWVSESFCIVRGDVFREVRGYGERLHYKKGQVLARQIEKAGFHALFTPDIHARDLHITVIKKPLH